MRDAWKERFVNKMLKYGIPGIVILLIPISLGMPQAVPLFIIAFAVLIAIPMSELFAHFFPDVFSARQWRSKPKPTFSIVRSLCRQEKYTEAIAELERMAAEDPQDLDIWLEMLEIAWMDLRDSDITESIYREALSVLETPASRNQIQNVYRNMTV